MKESISFRFRRYYVMTWNEIKKNESVKQFHTCFSFVNIFSNTLKNRPTLMMKQFSPSFSQPAASATRFFPSYRQQSSSNEVPNYDPQGAGTAIILHDSAVNRKRVIQRRNTGLWITVHTTRLSLISTQYAFHHLLNIRPTQSPVAI